MRAHSTSTASLRWRDPSQRASSRFDTEKTLVKKAHAINHNRDSEQRIVDRCVVCKRLKRLRVSKVEVVQRELWVLT